MKLDLLVAEIGSTTTVVNGFWLGEEPIFAGSGQAATTVKEGDVNIGLSHALENLKKSLGTEEILYDEFMATSSAAGGLRMTVHGLVYDMTVRAAKEAALGAGANIHLVTSGKLRASDLKKIKEINPNIMLLAGGVDYGERDTSLYNAEKIAELNLGIPIIYAGNIQNQEEIKIIFEGTSNEIYMVDNVYPRIDQLNVEPTRKVIQEVFEKHIVHAPGMTRVRELVKGSIIPTPAGVMEATKLLAEILGDVVTIDVGGATTDIHSVTEGTEEISRIMIAPEPWAKRTVEGDLGVYVNVNYVIELASKEKLAKELGLVEEEFEELIKNYEPIPKTVLEQKFVELLTLIACHNGILRHAGNYTNIYSSEGRKRGAEGKDLTGIKYIIGTGGALARLPQGVDILRSITTNLSSTKLLPNKDAQVLIDNHYIMASLGVMCKTYKKASIALLLKSLNLE